MKKRVAIFIWIYLLSPVYLFAQEEVSYFADGYHGGVYGHYPKWQTRFMMDKLREFPLWRINLEIEPETFDSVKAWDVSVYEEFREFVASQDGEKLEFTNPTYAQPYCYAVSGESLIRQFSYGMKRLKSHFPSLTFSTYAVEEPCFTSALPQMLTLLGFRYAVLKNPDTCWGGYTAAYGTGPVHWIGPDGTRILTVPRYAAEQLEENSTWQTTAWNNSDTYLNACKADGIDSPIGMCYQDAGWKNGPWIGEPGKNRSTYTLWTHYMDSVAGKFSAEEWKFSQEDVLVSLMWGSQVLQKLSQEIRLAEQKLVRTEKIASLQHFFRNEPWNGEVLDEAWRGLLLSQHHDCWIVPYNRMGSSSKTWAEHVHLYTSQSNALCDRLTGSEAPFSGIIRVYNTTGIDRRELVACSFPPSVLRKGMSVEDTEGNPVPVQISSDGRLFFYAHVPPMGYTSYTLSDKQTEIKPEGIVLKELPNGKIFMESDLYILEIDAAKGGTISSLYDKKNSKEWIDPDSEYACNGLRGNFYEEGGFLSSADESVELFVEEEGPLLAKIRVEGRIGTHPFSQWITLVQGDPRIDMELEIRWQGNPLIGEYKNQAKWENARRPYYDDRYKLHLLFPVSLENTKIDKNAPFDVCRSRLENTFFSSWDSIKHNIILNWVDLYAEKENLGLTLFSDHTTSYLHGTDYPLGITVQYAGTGLWGRNYGIDEPTRIHYSLFPHKGSWADANLTFENSRRNELLTVRYESEEMEKEVSFLALSDKQMEVSAMYYEGDDLLIRLYNEGKAGMKSVKLNYIPETIDEIDLNNDIIKPLSFMAGSGVAFIDLDMPAFAIKTLRVKYK